MNLTNVLALLSGVALFLFGMTLMSDNLKKVAGNSLELFLYKLSSNPLKAILFGTGITAAIQSSSATSVMVVGFVNSKMMKTKQAIAVIMGAIIGTSITGWIVSLSSINGSNGFFEIFSTDSLTAIIAIVGIYLRMFTKHTKQKHVGDILMGFAILMFGMKAMSNSVSVLKDSPLFIKLITDFSNPLIGVLVGVVFTAVIQSASAAVGILQALSSTGAIDFSVAFPILMGIGIGASLPVILSSLSASIEGKRVAFSYLIINTFGAVIMSILFYGLNALLNLGISNMILNTFSIALINTLYRAIFILLLSPFIDLIDSFTKRIIKSNDEDDEDVYEEDLLEDRFIAHPALAIEQCRLSINSMARFTMDNIQHACQLLINYNDKLFEKVNKKEDIVDRYADKLGTYLVKVTRKELTKSQNEQVTKFLHAIGDFERISDHALNIAQSAQQINEEGVTFSDSGNKEMNTLALAVCDMLAITVEAFLNNNINLAYTIEPFEQTIDDITEKMKENHIERLKNNECTLVHGIAFNDLITDLERVGDHCSNIALTIIGLESDSLDMHNFEANLTQEQKEHYNDLLNSYKSKYGI